MYTPRQGYDEPFKEQNVVVYTPGQLAPQIADLHSLSATLVRGAASQSCSPNMLSQLHSYSYNNSWPVRPRVVGRMIRASRGHLARDESGAHTPDGPALYEGG